MPEDLLLLRYPTRGARKVLDRQAARLPGGFRRGLDQTTDLYKQELVDASPEGETKQLKGSWRVRKSGTGGKARNVITNTSGHLGFVIKGTPAHEITARHIIQTGPRKGQLGYLRFEGRAGVTFRRTVHHPGTAPNPFHRAAIRAARGKATGVMRQVLVRTLKLQ